jgi:hypothetical protein
MPFSQIVTFIVMAFAGGLTLGVYLLSKRTIHVTTNVTNTAHGGGTATSGVSSGNGGGVSGFFSSLFNTVKWLAFAAIAALVVMGLVQKNTATPITVTVPAAPPPVIVTVPAPAVAAPPETVSVPTVQPIVGVPPALLVALLVALLIGAIGLGVMALIVVGQRSSQRQAPAQQPIKMKEVAPGHYRVIEKPSVSPSVERPISAAEYDDLFTKRTTVRR